MTARPVRSMSRSPAPRRRARRGADGRAFSLLELVVVIAILAVVSALVASKYANSVSQARVVAAARRIAADLQLAQTFARAQSKAVTVTFVPASGTYSIPGIVSPETRTGTYSVDLTKTPYGATLSSVSFGGSAAVTYNAYSTPSAAGTIVVTVGTATRTVTVDATSGVTSIQ